MGRGILFESLEWNWEKIPNSVDYVLGKLEEIGQSGEIFLINICQAKSDLGWVEFEVQGVRRKTL
jgi:hypothetical protein